MKYSGSVLLALLAVASTTSDVNNHAGRTPDSATRPVAQGASIPEPPNAPVMVGDRAPNFSWLGTDNVSHPLRELLEQAHALIVFAPDETTMRQLEAEREMLATLGVVPVAVLDDRARAANARARRANAHFLIIPDPVRVIGSQFNILSPENGRILPAWFAVDKRGVVRGYGGPPMPEKGWTRIAASALAIPLPDAPVPARTR